MSLLFLALATAAAVMAADASSNYATDGDALEERRQSASALYHRRSKYLPSANYGNFLRNEGYRAPVYGSHGHGERASSGSQGHGFYGKGRHTNPSSFGYRRPRDSYKGGHGLHGGYGFGFGANVHGESHTARHYGLHHGAGRQPTPEQHHSAHVAHGGHHGHGGSGHHSHGQHHHAQHHQSHHHHGGHAAHTAHHGGGHHSGAHHSSHGGHHGGFAHGSHHSSFSAGHHHKSGGYQGDFAHSHHSAHHGSNHHGHGHSGRGSGHHHSAHRGDMAHTAHSGFSRRHRRSSNTGAALQGL